MLWFMGTMFFLLRFKTLDFILLSRCFFNWWIGEAVVHDAQAILSNVTDVNIWADYRAWGRRLRTKWTFFNFCGVRYENFNGVRGKRWNCWHVAVPGETWKIKSFNNYNWRLYLRWNLRQISSWTTKSGSAGGQRCSFWTCSSRRSLDGAFRAENCKKWFGEAVRVQDLGKYWSNKVWFENSYKVDQHHNAVFESTCLSIPWGDLVHTMGAAVLLDVGWKVLNCHCERWSVSGWLFPII